MADDMSTLQIGVNRPTNTGHQIEVILTERRGNFN